VGKGAGSREQGVGSRGRESQKFELHSRKLDICRNSEQIFVQMFGDATNAFWLDSSLVEPGLSRFSFMGDGNGTNSLLVRYHTQTQELIITQSDNVTRHTESIFDYLKRELEYRRCQSDELPFDFNCGFVGYFGYELKAESGLQFVVQGQLEPRKNQHSPTPTIGSNLVSPLPDAIFLLADRMIAIDHQEKSVYLLQLVEKGETEQVKTWFDTIQEQLKTAAPLPDIYPRYSTVFKGNLCRGNLSSLPDKSALYRRDTRSPRILSDIASS
jgi:para-aminobenzoate synthetase